MKKTSIILLFIFIFSYSKLSATEPLSQTFNNGYVKTITRYVVNIPDEIKKDVKTDNPGIGSSLKLKNIDENGNYLFYSITDRGMNFDGLKLTTGEEVKIFSLPDFAPFISLIRVIPNQSATVEKIIKLDASGLPPPQSMTSSKLEVLLTSNLDKIKSDPKGIDSEGIAIDSQENFWVVDEYAPSLLKISPNGKVLERIDSSNGLPKIINARLENRGIESVTITPDNKIIFSMESILNINNETKDIAQFIRLVEFNPTTRKARMFAYNYDKDVYKSPTDVKIGDIVALDNKHLLVIEQGKTKNGEMRHTIQLAGLSNATDISTSKLANGKELEYGNANDLSQINFAQKKLIMNMREYNWPYEKLEGIAYVDPTHIAIINDNDFGYDIGFTNNSNQTKQNYTVDLKNKTLLYKGEPSNAKLHYKPTGINTELWIIELQKPIEISNY